MPAARRPLPKGMAYERCLCNVASGRIVTGRFEKDSVKLVAAKNIRKFLHADCSRSSRGIGSHYILGA